jgi:hypothetical protein
MRPLLGAVLAVSIGVGLVSCGKSGQQCLQLPCAMPVAIELRVTVIDGGSLTDVVVQVSGASTATISCGAGTTESACVVPGAAGTYELQVSASGFASARRIVTVAGATPECGCPTTITEHVDVQLGRVR